MILVSFTALTRIIEYIINCCKNHIAAPWFSLQKMSWHSGSDGYSWLSGLPGCCFSSKFFFFLSYTFSRYLKIFKKHCRSMSLTIWVVQWCCTPFMFSFCFKLGRVLIQMQWQRNLRSKIRKISGILIPSICRKILGYWWSCNIADIALKRHQRSICSFSYKVSGTSWKSDQELMDPF